MYATRFELSYNISTMCSTVPGEAGGGADELDGAALGHGLVAAGLGVQDRRRYHHLQVRDLDITNKLNPI